MFTAYMQITVEKYLIEIARYYNVVYDPDPQVSVVALFSCKRNVIIVALRQLGT
jgi:hypothetical protein